MADIKTGWFHLRIGDLRYFPKYVEEIARQWVNLLFGETLLAALFLIWWALGNPPLILIFVCAALLAGYYAWLPNHTRLVPILVARRVVLEQTPTNHANTHRTYIQILPECLTDKPIENCRGILLRVWRRADERSEWEPTPLNQPLELNWSYLNVSTITLEPNLGQRINVAWIDNMMPRLLPDTTTIPMQVYAVFSNSDSFKFDVEIVGKECPPALISVVVDNAHVWNELRITSARLTA
jgi:hypothetical protein